MQLNPVLLPLCLCTAVGAVWLYNRVGQSIGGVVRKHVLGYETPEEEEGGQALQCCLGASLQITFQKLFMKYSKLEPSIQLSKKMFLFSLKIIS